MNKDELNKIIALYVIGIGPNGTPNGHLYAERMADGVSLDTHAAIVAAIIESGLAKQSNFFLTLTESGEQLYMKIATALLERKQH